MLSPSIKIIEHMCSEFWCLLFYDWFWVKVVWISLMFVAYIIGSLVMVFANVTLRYIHTLRCIWLAILTGQTQEVLPL